MANQNVYIMSLEAANIWEHMNRNKYIKKNYVGMLPNSLELTKLQKIGLKTFDSKRYNKTMTNDIINVKFKQKVRSAEEIIDSLNKTILDLDENEEERVNKLCAYMESLEKEKDLPKWQEVKNGKLRQKLYDEGFTITEVNDKTGEIIKTEYVVFGRTSSKSRTGQVLFIRKALKDKMIKWKRLGMSLDGRNDIDFPGLLSYESLVSSATEDLIKIDTKNILIVSDVKSVFPIDCNVVEVNKDGLLVSNPVDNYMMVNDIFDGEGLLESGYFDSIGMSDKGFILTRQHHFKCCMFNTRIQLFLQDYAKDNNIDFDTWQIPNMFGESILAKNVHCIITPASLKALKLSNVMGSKNKMWKHWKKKIEEEGCLFGICKSDKQSKRGTDAEGNIVNQTSYQMLNSMPIGKYDMQLLSQFECDYIEQLKNNDSVYVEYLRQNANVMNANEMLADLYDRNNKIAYTKIFKDKRKKDIHNYVNYIKQGKIRLIGDYCTILGNGWELLHHAIGQLPVDNNNVLDYESWKDRMILNGNEVYSTLHEFNKEYVCFRNPNTAASNVLIVQNKDNEFIHKYFKLSDNIIYTNAINFPICRILSGQDLDSDSLIQFDNDVLLSNAKKCYGRYRVCVNGVGKNDNQYTVSTTDMANIDNTLAKSQKYIGQVVNLGMHYLSTYWHMVNNNIDDIDKINKLLEAVDVCTVLSEISIDSAKRMYNVDIDKQIAYLSKSNLLSDKKPLFFKYISQSDNIKNKIEKYDTAMDYLQEIMDNIDDADSRRTVNLLMLLTDRDMDKVKDRQVQSIVKVISDMTKKVKSIEAQCQNNENDDEDKEKYSALDDIRSEFEQRIKHYKIKVETIYTIIYKVFTGDIKCKYKTDLLNALYNANKEIFLATLKKST